jgi:hypothetical protein
MKKFNLVITALLILSVAAFAVDVEPSATVSGEASVTFTYDLDAEAFDIANDASAELDVVFIANTSVEEGEGDVVGYIQISGIQFSIQDIDGGAGSITTNSDDDSIEVFAAIYLMGPTLHLDITNTSNDLDFAGAPDFIDDGDHMAVTTGLVETVTDLNPDTLPSGQVTLVYDTDMIDVSVVVADDDDFAGNEFDFGFTVGLAPVEGLTVDAGVILDASGDLGFGGAVGYSLDIASVSVGVDSNDAGDLDIAASVGVDVGATVDVTFGTDTENSDLIVTASTGTLVEMVTLAATVELANLETLGLQILLDADLGVVTPYAYFELVNEVMGIKVGSGLNVIENADLDLHYVSSDLDNVNGKVVFEIGPHGIMLSINKWQSGLGNA